MEKEAVELLSKLISIPTVNPPGENYYALVEFAERYFRGLGFDVEVFEVPRAEVAARCPECADHPRPILLARLGEPRIHLNGHYDVVPPGPPEAWRVTRPFQPHYANGRLYGRGAVDMKGGLTSIMLAAAEAARRKLPLEVSFVPDEETGGETGAGYLVRSGRMRAKAVVIAEGSGQDNIWIGHRGLVWFLVEVFGKQAHGSTPWNGLNAFEGAARLAVKIAEEYVKLISARASPLPYDDPRGARPTVTVGGEVRGSVKANVVPGYFAFTVDRRVIPEESLEEVEREFLEFVREASRGLPYRVEVKVVNRSEAAMVEPDHPLVRSLSHAVARVLGREPRRTVCIGGLDARFFVKAGMPTVTYGPGPIGMAHAPDEYVEVEQVINVARAYVELLSG